MGKKLNLKNRYAAGHIYKNLDGTYSVYNWDNTYCLGTYCSLKDARIRQFHNKGLNEAKEELGKLGLSNIDMEFVEHHLSHALSIFPIIGDDFKSKKLIFTMDGSGDGLSSTVSIYDNGKIERIAQTDASGTIGGVYSQTTRFLGMKIFMYLKLS